MLELWDFFKISIYKIKLQQYFINTMFSYFKII